MGNRAEQDIYTQPVLSELNEQENAEITLERVVVETLPTFTQRNGVYSWDCQAYAEPNIFEQERNEHYQLHARTYAQQAKKKRLRPGDIVTLTGIPYTQEIETTGGNKKLIHHLNVTRIEVLGRSKRVSLTVYEKQQKK